VQTYVLVADSDDHVAKTARAVLKGMVHRVDHATDGPTALLMIQDVDYSLIILDLLLPKLGGRSLCAGVRMSGCRAPILAVTADVESISPLLGLQTGVDDYLPKPVDAAELQVRAGALIHNWTKARARSAPRAPVQVGDLLVDPLRHEVCVQGRPIGAVCAREVELLYFLAQHPGVPYSKEELISAVWGIDCRIDFKLAGVDLQRLRKKLAAAGHEYLTSTEETHTGNKRYFVALPAWLKAGPVTQNKRPMEIYGKP
jgi:DNA-binding response OmpR family regulator